MSLSVPSGGPVFWGYLLAFVAATLVCLGAAWRAWHIPYAGTRHSLLAFFLTSAVWAGSYIGFLLPVSPLAKHFFYQVSLVVGFGTVWAWLWFCSAYTGRAIHRNASAQWFAIVVYGGVTLLKVTNPLHHLYYTLEPGQGGVFDLVVRHGLFYWVVMGVAYALATAGYLMLFEMFWKTETRTGPLAALTALTALPAVLNIAGHVNPTLQDITHEPLGVAVFAIGVLFVYSYQFQAVRLAGSLSAPTIMLSADGRIKDYGRRIIELFPEMEDRSAIGKPLGAALPELAQKLKADRPLLETTDGSAPRYYRIVETSLGATGGRDVVVLSDITERERRERALRDRQEKVEALYAAISRLLRAQNREEVGDVVLRLVNEVFGYPLVGVRFVDDGALVPIRHSPKVSERMPSRPPVDLEGDSLIAEAYENEEPNMVDDLQAVDDPVDYGDACTAAFFPVGRHGTISVGDVEQGAIDSFDGGLIEVLAAHAAVVLDRLDQEEALRTAKQEAEEASQMKSALLANTSHEFRTPLTSIIGFAEEIATMAEDDDSPIGRFADHIEDSGHRLLSTLDAILNLSRLQGGDMRRSAEPTDMITVAEEAADQFYPEAVEEDITLRTKTNGAPVWTHADREGLRIAVQNLISNAVKYTEPGGDVWVRVRTGDEAAVLEVEDTGVGMDPARTERLFEPFRQESEGMGREYEGTGLGLAVTKEAVEQMGGVIEVETEKGQGSCFTVRLPEADAHEKATTET
ncbi:ATP-binding protein [Salinibacter grassmerensis]|uniref:ATP-binding protein n=1 Tax=Salinibacter grassmerensis TaxID=3040353 RepID=UPI0021E7A14E|nr:ATP-binding protein [Salinibacter grassmerensis]